MELAIAVESVCRIILRAREYEALQPDDDGDELLDSEGEPVDTDHISEDDEDAENPAESELRAIIDDLADDEQAEVIALALVGRGSFEAEEWADAMTAASEEIFDAANWLLAQPMLSSDLEAGLAAFDLSCDGVGTVV